MPKVFPVACHTDHVGPGTTFIAIKGDKQDGTAYIAQALLSGASTIVVQQDVELKDDILVAIKRAGATLQRVSNTRQALALLSAQANGYPSKKLKIIGVTGTKGKSSTVFMLEHILNQAGYKTALLSTVYNKITGTVLPSFLTTEQPDYLHSFFSLCVKHDVQFVVMEVAAQALSLHRVEGIEFDGALFTNFDKEHGEFYKNLESYFEAKSRLFRQLKPEAPILINADDKWGKRLLGKLPQALSFGLNDRSSFFSGQIIEILHYLSCVIVANGKESIAICNSLFGEFNAYNMLGAISMAFCLKISFEQSVAAMQSFKGIPGRLECYQLPNKIKSFIDHAHNPSSFRAVLSALRPMTEQLIVVFGAGGERDAKKRPDLGLIVSHYADQIILTSDNPRSEDPKTIIQQILSGISVKDRTNVLCILDREEAIKKAYTLARSGAIIALLGKGCEEYQVIGAKKIPFSERSILKNL